ncbi:MIZ/SP-RING_zinc finger domain-containing protein [Hexamita inflata]|uniref:MIZ/SP-RING zinc finger domain-containing protein n=1 Tax=Hexamita inflata TaxID=28002 RepID=A0AA86QFK6_9EUKA|nr:MIZ/SP-RING zinc finger domain-containing protein [Hexamita inflata]CAI9963290.1 MIZ/SP-RING zinc finger domain-containing protein [Hexamita inflata]
MNQQSIKLFKELQQLLELPENYLQRPDSLLLATLKPLCSCISLAYNITPPDIIRKKLLVEFVKQNIDVCLRTVPTWLESDTPNDLYLKLANNCGQRFDAAFERLKPVSPFCIPYKQLGIYTFQNNLIKFKLTFNDLELLKNKSAALAAYYLDQHNNLIYMNDIYFNGVKADNKIQPYYLQNSQETNLLFQQGTGLCVVQIVKTLSTDEIFQQLLMKPLLTTQHYAQILKLNNFQQNIQIVSTNENDEESDLQVEQETVKLTSSLSMSRIKFPVRSSLCRHFQQFMDLEEFLSEIKTGENKWTCQICQKSCKISQLFVDAFGFFLIQREAGNIVQIRGTEIDFGNQKDQTQGNVDSDSEQSMW